ncbi:MAG: hypothetical protein ABFS34_16175 [Gemmatimonadota bacterium]
MTSRHFAAAALAGTLCGGLLGCGPHRHLPVELTGAPAGTPSAVEVDGARYHLEVSDEWVRVSVDNLTDDTLRLDVAGLVFRGPNGLRHRLVAGDHLSLFEASRSRPTEPNEPITLRVQLAPPPPLRHRPAHLAVRQLEPDRPLVRIAPGGSYEDYFYPAEHLRLDPSGLWSVSRLFCSHPKGAELAGLNFEVAVPARDGLAVHRVLLEGRVTKEPSPL